MYCHAKRDHDPRVLWKETDPRIWKMNFQEVCFVILAKEKRNGPGRWGGGLDVMDVIFFTIK